MLLVDLTTNVFSVWNFLVSLIVILSTATLFYRLNQKSYIKVQNEALDGWKDIHEQKVIQIQDLERRFEAFKAIKESEISSLNKDLLELRELLAETSRKHTREIEIQQDEMRRLGDINLQLQFEKKDLQIELEKRNSEVVILRQQVDKLSREVETLKAVSGLIERRSENREARA